MRDLQEIKKFLKEHATEQAKSSWEKSVPTAKKIWGVPVAQINEIVSKYKSGGFELVQKLWESGYLEEQLLAVKILGKIAKKDPEQALALIEKFAKELDNWAVCDTLATQGVRALVKTHKEKILALADKFLRSKTPWQRRFGLVLFINFRKDAEIKPKVAQILKQFENESNYYVKKAIDWVKRSLKL